MINTLAEDLKLGALSGGEIPAELVPASDFRLDITGSGGSPRQLASSIDGKVLFTQGPGRVKNDLIGKLSGDLIAQIFGALNPFAAEEEFSNWDCTIFAIDFVSGEGDISGFLLQGEKIMVVGGGKIDMNTERLNIEFNTKPREGVGVSADMFVTPFVAVSGTLAERIKERQLHDVTKDEFKALDELSEHDPDFGGRHAGETKRSRGNRVSSASQHLR